MFGQKLLFFGLDVVCLCDSVSSGGPCFRLGPTTLRLSLLNYTSLISASRSHYNSISATN